MQEPSPKLTTLCWHLRPRLYNFGYILRDSSVSKATSETSVVCFVHCA